MFWEYSSSAQNSNRANAQTRLEIRENVELSFLIFLGGMFSFVMIGIPFFFCVFTRVQYRFLTACYWFLTPYYQFLTPCYRFLTACYQFLTPCYQFLTPYYRFLTYAKKFITFKNQYKKAHTKVDFDDVYFMFTL